MTGVLLNILTVLAGTIVGMLFGRLIPERFRKIAFYAIGSCTLAFGVVMIISGYGELSASEVGSLAAIVLVVSMVAGSLTGELLRIEERLEGLGSLMQKLLPERFSQKKATRAKDAAGAWQGALFQGGAGAEGAELATEAFPAVSTVRAVEDAQGTDERGKADKAGEASSSRAFSEGFMVASVFFCTGAMTLMGSIQAGLGDPSTLYLKSTLDGISSIALSTALGIGVGFSVVTICVVQGGLVLASGALAGLISPAIMASIELVGGTMLMALGLDILGIKKLKVGNMLPALVYAIVLAAFLGCV